MVTWKPFLIEMAQHFTEPLKQLCAMIFGNIQYFVLYPQDLSDNVSGRKPGYIGYIADALIYLFIIAREKQDLFTIIALNYF